MKYLILRRRLSSENAFTEAVSASGGGKTALPLQAETQDLTDQEVEDLRRDERVENLVPSIPFTLVEPVEQAPVDSVPALAWGVVALGAANSLETTGAGVTVAVLDTGIDVKHPAFAGLTFNPADLMDFTVDENGVAGAAPDVNGHGTHVAGTIFGRAVNGTRIGVAPGVSKVLIGKVLGPNGGSTETIYNAIDWALRRRADVISMSLGMNLRAVVTRMVQDGFPADIAAARALEAYRSNVRLFDRLAALVDSLAARGRGALLVAASGNESRRNEDSRFTAAVAPPAAADGFISVGAVGRSNQEAYPFVAASFSNTGCTLSAPGVSILSARLGGGLIKNSGTSMATPHVAGTIALWTQKLFPDGSRPSGWAKDVRRALEVHVLPAPREMRQDLGLGVVQAPQ